MNSFRRYAWLFWLWTRRDIVSRYAGSVIGLFWAVVHPLATIGVFYFVFAVVLQVRLPELASDSGYFLYLLAGLLPWLSLADGLLRSTSALVAQEQFLSRTPFPVAILPVSAIVSALVPQLIGTALLIVLTSLAGLLDPLRVVVFFPLILLAQLLLTIGVGCTLSMLSVHVRDTVQIVPVVTQILFYATPIIYPKSMIPETYQGWLAANPVACLLAAYHWVFLGLPMPKTMLWALLVWVIVLGVGGWMVFRALKPTLGDHL